MNDSPVIIGTIPEVVKRINEEGIHVSEYVVRMWTKAEHDPLPSIPNGNRSLISYYNVMRRLFDMGMIPKLPDSMAA